MNTKKRVLLWSAVGFLVSLSWFLYATSSAAPMTLGNRTVWNIARVTQPLILTGLPLKFYWVFLVNAVTYGLIGLTFETVRRGLSHAR